MRVPQRWQEYPDLVGTYGLYPSQADTAGAPNAVMCISTQQGNQFTIGIAVPTGHAGLDWEGRGSIDGKGGHYDWVFVDGKAGRTTFIVDADGNLRGKVRGGGIDWDYVGKRREGPVKLP